MTAHDRLLDIEEKYRGLVSKIVPVEIDEGALRLTIFFNDKSNLRVTELWKSDKLVKYSYYWLSNDNGLIVGWDNAPHHKRVNSFPHHKHVKIQKNIQPSSESRLEDVMDIILQEKAR
ncbi:MAG: DUF6516 family protein [Desulfonatronovibrio sp.]